MWKKKPILRLYKIMHLITFCKRSCVGNIVPQYNNVDLLSNNQNCYRTIKTWVVGVREKFWYKQKLEKKEMGTLFRIISANTLYCSVLIYPFQDSQCEPEQYDTVENVIFHLWKRLIRKTQIHYMPETQSIRKKKKNLENLQCRNYSPIYEQFRRKCAWTWNSLTS